MLLAWSVIRDVMTVPGMAIVVAMVIKRPLRKPEYLRTGPRRTCVLTRS